MSNNNKKQEFTLLLPEKSEFIPNESQNLPTRNWVFSGERILLFLKMENVVNIGESFSFFCSSIECNIRDPNSLTISTSQFNLDQKAANSYIGTNIFLDRLSSTKILPNPSPIYKSDGISFFPLKFTIPLTSDKKITIGAFQSLSESPLATATFTVVDPFCIHRRFSYAPQTYFVSFCVKANIPNDINCFVIRNGEGDSQENAKEDNQQTGEENENNSETRSGIVIKSVRLSVNDKIFTDETITQNICIIPVHDVNQEVFYDNDEISLTYMVKVLNSLGSVHISNLPLALNIIWTHGDHSNELTSTYLMNTLDYLIEKNQLKNIVLSPEKKENNSQNSTKPSEQILPDLVLSAQNIDCSIHTSSSLPITVSMINAKDKLKQMNGCDVTLHFVDKKSVQEHIAHEESQAKADKSAIPIPKPPNETPAISKASDVDLPESLSGCGVQPIVEHMTLHFTHDEPEKVIGFPFIPLVFGQHELRVYATLKYCSPPTEIPDHSHISKVSSSLNITLTPNPSNQRPPIPPKGNPPPRSATQKKIDTPHLTKKPTKSNSSRAFDDSIITPTRGNSRDRKRFTSKTPRDDSSLGMPGRSNVSKSPLRNMKQSSSMSLNLQKSEDVENENSSIIAQNPITRRVPPNSHNSSSPYPLSQDSPQQKPQQIPQKTKESLTTLYTTMLPIYINVLRPKKA